MHDAAVVGRALSLKELGLPVAEIARTVGVPRGTVVGWLSGRLPHSYRRLGCDASGCDACGGEAHDFTCLPEEYVYLLGLYLGDGCISAGPRDVFRLRISLDERYPAIVDECVGAVRAVRPQNAVARRSSKDNYVEVSAYWKGWPCLFPQHGPGKKHERAIVLTEWQEALVVSHPGLLLRGLIHSDGSRFANTGRGRGAPRYNFRNRSGDIRAIFKDACGLLGLRPTEARNGTVYVSRKADVAVLDRFVGPKS